MKREIKFRAWTGSEMEYKVMAGYLGAFYVAGIDPKDTASMSPMNTIYSENTPVMQFTGLKDKNGKECYEGDIIISEDSEIERIIEFRDGCFTEKNSFPTTPLPKNFEVIGNIYQNPDFLK